MIMSGLEGTTFKHYHIQRLLKRGGMSEVYLAYDEQMQREVAVKVVNSSQVGDIKRLQREVNIISTLTHDHILPVYDSGIHDQWHYMVMPYMEHGTLRERLSKQPLTQEEAGVVLEQIASALQYAHDRGIIHRDIKPTNVLLRDEQYIYLADFGVAKALAEGSTLTQTGFLIGTPKYIAPELAFEPASTLSDIYALGILLYEMLTGQTPFEGGSPLEVCQKHIYARPTPPSVLNPAISHSVEQIMLRALEKDARLRFQTPQDMVQAYKSALMTAPTASTPPQVVIRAIPGYRSSTRMALATVVALVLLLGTAVLLVPLAYRSSLAQTSTVSGTSTHAVTATESLQKKSPTATPRGSSTAQSTPTSVSQQQGGANGPNQGHQNGHGHGGKGHGKNGNGGGNDGGGGGGDNGG